MPADVRFQALCQQLGCALDGDLQIGGSYTPVMADGHVLYVSGQVPRVGNEVLVTGRVGATVSLAQAQLAAKVCALRALAFLQRQLGSLEQVQQILRLTVYVQSTEHFTQHSEVADAASDVLTQVLGQAGLHSRTSVGVYQLPKNASVELDVIAAAKH